MKFSDLKFRAHNVLPGASIATHTFANQWKISVVTGHKSGGLHISKEKPYEVAILLPDGKYLGGDVFGYQTKEDIDAILARICLVNEVISKDDIDKEKFTSKNDYFMRLFLAK